MLYAAHREEHKSYFWTSEKILRYRKKKRKKVKWLTVYLVWARNPTECLGRHWISHNSPERTCARLTIIAHPFGYFLYLYLFLPYSFFLLSADFVSISLSWHCLSYQALAARTHTMTEWRQACTKDHRCSRGISVLRPGDTSILLLYYYINKCTWDRVGTLPCTRAVRACI